MYVLNLGLEYAWIFFHGVFFSKLSKRWIEIYLFFLIKYFNFNIIVLWLNHLSIDGVDVSECGNMFF